MRQSSARRRWGWFDLMSVWVVILVAVLSPQTLTGDELVAASDGRHVFVVRPAIESDGFEVVHIDVEAGPGAGRTVYRTTRRPEAMAASGDRCILVLAPADADRPSRLAISFRVVQHPINDAWYADPPGEPTVLPVLPRGGELVGLAAMRDGCVAVWRPSQKAARMVERAAAVESEPSEPESDASESDASEGLASIPEAGGIHLWSGPGAGEWVPLDLPRGFERAVEMVVGQAELGGGPTPAVAWRDVDGGITVARLDGDRWIAADVGRTVDPGTDGALVSVLRLPDRTLLAELDAGGKVEVLDLLDADDGRRFDSRRFASVEGASGAIAVLGTESGPWVIGRRGGEIRIETLDRVDGAVRRSVVVEEVDIDGSLIEFPIYVTLMLAVMVVAILLRPHVEGRPAVPAAGLVASGLLRRAAGLCIDLAPGLMVAVVVFDLDPAVFFEEIRDGDPGAAGPVLFAVAVASVITAVLEVLVGRSLGKFVVGLRVAALDGGPASRCQRGLRAGLRFVTLLFWPITLVAILDPLGRGIPEFLSRTVVVPNSAPLPEASPPQGPDEA